LLLLKKQIFGSKKSVSAVYKESIACNKLSSKGALRISAGCRPAALTLYYLSSEGAQRDIKKFCNFYALNKY